MSRTNPTWWERVKAEGYMFLNGSEAPDHYDGGVHAHHDAVIRNSRKKIVVKDNPKPRRNTK